jgi:hypothetical protein
MKLKIFVAVASFLSGRAKDLSAPLYHCSSTWSHRYFLPLENFYIRLSIIVCNDYRGASFLISFIYL